MKNNPREILVLLHHLKNSSLFCVCMEIAGFPKLFFYLPCVTSALHCREQKEQLCYTEFNNLFFSDCRALNILCIPGSAFSPALQQQERKPSLFVKQICSSGLSPKAATGNAFGNLVKSAVQEPLETQIYSLWGNH